jgi:hypothetical protein
MSRVKSGCTRRLIAGRCGTLRLASQASCRDTPQATYFKPVSAPPRPGLRASQSRRSHDPKAPGQSLQECSHPQAMGGVSTDEIGNPNGIAFVETPQIEVQAGK